MSQRMIHNREIYLNEETLKDLIAAHLYATTVVADDEEVLEVVLGPPNGQSVRSIQYKTIKNKEAELIVHS